MTKAKAKKKKGGNEKRDDHKTTVDVAQRKLPRRSCWKAMLKKTMFRRGGSNIARLPEREIRTSRRDEMGGKT